MCRTFELFTKKEFLSGRATVFRQSASSAADKETPLGFYCMLIITPTSFMRCLFSAEIRNLLYTLIVPLHIPLSAQYTAGSESN